MVSPQKLATFRKMATLPWYEDVLKEVPLIEVNCMSNTDALPVHAFCALTPTLAANPRRTRD